MLNIDPSGEAPRAVPAALARASAGALLLGLAGLVACSGSPEPDDGAPLVSAPDTVRGSVRQVGSSPFVRTLVEGADTVTVTGDLESEISRLSGARVLVTGTLDTDDYPGPKLRAVSYRILSVDGHEPAVGVLAEDGEGFYLERPDAEPVRLRAVSSGLAGRVGAKIWAVTGEDGSVRRYGILRPPEK